LMQLPCNFCVLQCSHSSGTLFCEGSSCLASVTGVPDCTARTYVHQEVSCRARVSVDNLLQHGTPSVKAAPGLASNATQPLKRLDALAAVWVFVWIVVACMDECWKVLFHSTVCVLFDLRADQRASHHGLDITDTRQHQLQNLS
jgi:hypothetical protein